MTFGEKEQPEKIFCLFHEKTDCDCLAPVINEKTLIMRLDHHIRLNNILLENMRDQEEISKMQDKSAVYQKRLDAVENKSAAGTV
jgi:hypothetical protein